MNKSTEINTLPQSENNNDTSNELVNNIINEIKNNEEGVNMEINENPNPQGTNLPPQPQMYNPQIQQQIPPHLDPANDGIPFNLDNNYPDQIEIQNDTDNDDMLTKIIQKLKNPLVVFIILFIMLLPLLDKYLSKLMPNLYVNNNSLSIIGVFVKSLIGTLLFYLSTLL